MRVRIPKAVLWGGIIASLPRDGKLIDDDCLEQVKSLLLDVAYSSLSNSVTTRNFGLLIRTRPKDLARSPLRLKSKLRRTKNESPSH